MEEKQEIPSKEVEVYFRNYENEIRTNREKYSKSKLLQYYRSIKQEFISVSNSINEGNCLSSMHHLLLLDAKLQILFFFWLDDKYHHCTENKIIEMAEADYKDYYNEMVEIPEFGRTPKPLIFI
ncbi:DUF7006 family protein [Enterococcus sp. AZ196]|uniref:DUF7006 family protein n=1 Tax=Enterococcus sp. AZ196 TaxID=2774659 RepID=UPI003D297033